MADEEMDSRIRLGLPGDATDEEKRYFISRGIDFYNRETQWRSDDLSEYFADVFRFFTADDAKNIDLDDRCRLRDLLGKRGVYVPKGHNILISDFLFQIVKNDLPWPEEQKKIFDDTTKEEKDDNDSDKKVTELGMTSKKTIPTKDGSDYSTATYRKESLSNLFEAYSKETEKYSVATTDEFDRKFTMFLERSDQSNISTDERVRAFSIMLTGTARPFYLNALRLKNSSLEDLAKSVKSRFHTQERSLALLREWDTMSLKTILYNNPDKSPSDCLELLIRKLSDIQTSLPEDYQSDTNLRDKPLNAVRDVADCPLAYHKPSDTVQGVISDLHALLAASERATANSTNTHDGPSVRYIHRRYVRAFQNSRRHNRNTPSRKCIVCGQIGCGSTNQPIKKRLEALKKNKTLRQFMILLDDDDSDDDDQQLADALKDVTAHIIDMKSIDDDEDNSADGLLSHMATIDDTDKRPFFTATLQEAAIIHALTADSSPLHYNSSFYGVVIDTGCARGSSGGHAQYLAYCKPNGQKPTIDSTKARHCQFGIGSEMSKGTATIDFTLGDLWFSFDVHVVSADVPILLDLPHTDCLGVFFNNLDNCLVHPQSRQSAPATRLFGHAFIQWDPHVSCQLTTIELRRLHRRFGHPSTDKRYRLLERADISNVNADTRRTLSKIERECLSCQSYAQRPSCLKFTLREDKDFNHTVYADVFYIDKIPVLHVVDDTTNYQVARWLPTLLTDALWKALRLCWIDVYLGPPDVIAHDTSKDFMEDSFSSQADLLHIRKRAIPVESANTMTIIERYQQPVRRAFSIIRAEAPDVDFDIVLQMAVKAINDSLDPDRLVPTLLVYGALPRLGLSHGQPTPSTFARAKAIRKATSEMSKHFAKRQVPDAVRTRNGHNVSDIHSIPIGGHAVVYRRKKNRWEGPYSVLDINGENTTVLLSPPPGPTKYRSTVLERYVSPTTHDLTISPDLQNDQTSSESTSVKADIPPSRYNYSSPPYSTRIPNVQASNDVSSNFVLLLTTILRISTI